FFLFGFNTERSEFFRDRSPFLFQSPAQDFGFFGLPLDASEIVDCIARRFRYLRACIADYLAWDAEALRNLQTRRRTGHADEQTIGWSESLLVKLNTGIQHPRLIRRI